ncbi:MAG: hypothetical protein ACXWLO_04600 [Rhizomicrobium sp.]
MTPDRAREVIRAQSQFPYWGNYQKFMTPEEIAFVRGQFEHSESGNVSFAGIIQRRARADRFDAPPDFDEQDAAIAQERLAAWNERPGPRVGDYVIMPDESTLRFTHDWGDSIQTTCKRASGDVSFYFCHGHMSFSGSLDPSILKADLTDTGELRNGSAWFFHHNRSGARRGVYFTVPCRVFRYAPKAAP